MSLNRLFTNLSISKRIKRKFIAKFNRINSVHADICVYKFIYYTLRVSLCEKTIMFTYSYEHMCTHINIRIAWFKC